MCMILIEGTRKERGLNVFIFSGQVCAGVIVYLTRENFLAFPGLVVLISSSLPASAYRTKERRTFPTNRGRGEPLGSRRGWKKKFPSRRENEETLQGEPENNEGDKGSSGKNKKEQEGTRKNKSSKNVTSVRYHVEMRACAGFNTRTNRGGRKGSQGMPGKRAGRQDKLLRALKTSFQHVGLFVLLIFQFTAERKERPLLASRGRIQLDLGEEEKHYGGEKLSVNGSLKKL